MRRQMMVGMFSLAPLQGAINHIALLTGGIVPASLNRRLPSGIPAGMRKAADGVNHQPQVADGANGPSGPPLR
jgi:hypothetical protein